MFVVGIIADDDYSDEFNNKPCMFVNPSQLLKIEYNRLYIVSIDGCSYYIKDYNFFNDYDLAKTYFFALGQVDG